jgi:phosphate transport system protein
MDRPEHTSHEFEAELKDVREHILVMGSRVDEVVDAAGRALVDRDVALANRVILSDAETDSMELELDHLCLQILARRQPVASDLRLLTTALKVVVDLERVGDLGVSIATRVVELAGEPPLFPYEDLFEMLTTARHMVSDALGALVDEDVARARRVIDKDAVINAYERRIFEAILCKMGPDSRDNFRATRLQANLEVHRAHRRPRRQHRRARGLRADGRRASPRPAASPQRGQLRPAPVGRPRSFPDAPRAPDPGLDRGQELAGHTGCRSAFAALRPPPPRADAGAPLPTRAVGGSG